MDLVEEGFTHGGELVEVASAGGGLVVGVEGEGGDLGLGDWGWGLWGTAFGFLGLTEGHLGVAVFDRGGEAGVVAFSSVEGWAYG